MKWSFHVINIKDGVSNLMHQDSGRLWHIPVDPLEINYDHYWTRWFIPTSLIKEDEY